MESRAAVVLRPDEGRSYPMERIAAIFKAFVIEGTMSFLVIDAPKGSFVLGPAGATHNFEEHMPAIAQWFSDHPPGYAADQ
jgi:hypothetical protein